MRQRVLARYSGRKKRSETDSFSQNVSELQRMIGTVVVMTDTWL